MEVEISSNVKFFKLYPRGRETRSWDSISAFKFVKSQTAKIFLTPDHTGDVHNASMMQVPHAHNHEVLGKIILGCTRGKFIPC